LRLVSSCNQLPWSKKKFAAKAEKSQTKERTASCVLPAEQKEEERKKGERKEERRRGGLVACAEGKKRVLFRCFGSFCETKRTVSLKETEKRKKKPNKEQRTCLVLRTLKSWKENTRASSRQCSQFSKSMKKFKLSMSSFH
jgi:hypothetical protein